MAFSFVRLGVRHAEIQKFVFADGKLDIDGVDGTDRYQCCIAGSGIRTGRDIIDR